MKSSDRGLHFFVFTFLIITPDMSLTSEEDELKDVDIVNFICSQVESEFEFENSELYELSME